MSLAISLVGTLLILAKVGYVQDASGGRARLTRDFLGRCNGFHDEV